MDAQGYIPLYTICMHLGMQGMYLDFNQIKIVSLNHQALKSVSGTTVSEDSDRVFVYIPNRKTLVTLQGVSAAQADKVKAHVEKSQAKIQGCEYKDKEQSLCYRTVDEAEATGLTSWLKANPLEVQ